MPADSQRGVLYLFTTTRRPLANFPTQNKTWSKLLEKEQQLEDVINVGSQEQAFYVVLGLYPCSIFMATTSDDNKDVRARATSTEKGRQYCDAETGKNRPSNHRSSWEGGGGFPEIFQNELVSRSKGVRRRRLNNNKKTVKKQRRNDRMNSLPQSTGMGRQRQQQQATPTTMTNSRRVGPVADRQ